MSAAVPRAMIDLSFRRAALMAGPDAPLQDVIDLAELAFLADERAGALLLFGAAALERGLGDDGLRWQAGVAARTGLWRAPDAPTTSGREPMLDRALAELRRLCASPLPRADCPDMAEPADPQVEPAELAEMPPEALRAFCDTVAAPLRAVLEQGRDAAVEPLFDAVLRAVGAWTPADPSKYAGSDPATLACVVACVRLRRLALPVAELRAAGWDHLVEPAIRLAGDGLGPLFANVPRLVRRAEELAGFVRLATPAPFDLENEAAWMVALTVQAPPRMARGLADLCARRGMTGALRAFVRRGLATPEREWLWAVRDAALAFGHGRIAAEAQGALLVLSPTSYSEAVILGDMLGLLGEVAPAVAAFDRCLLLHASSDVLVRREALGTDDFEVLARSGGFFAEPERRHIALTLEPPVGSVLEEAGKPA